MSYRLCFISRDSNRNAVFYFTDKFKTQWGDDWRSRGWYNTAGTPYVYNDNVDDEGYNDNCGHIRVIVASFMEYDAIEYPGYEYSVEDINKKRTAWAYSQEYGALQAGATMAETFKFLAHFDCLYGELKQRGKVKDVQDSESVGKND